MGVDLILGAKLVNHEGSIVEADERMLQAIRGGGGTLGVIVEMRIKVFPLDKVQLPKLEVCDLAEPDLLNRFWAVWSFSTLRK
jgi:hypothetical protein